LALISHLPLKSFLGLLPFIRYAGQVVQQLKKSDGLLGCSLFAQPLSKQFWTLSAWRDEDALQTFVHAKPHVRIMSALAPHMAETKFARWRIRGSELPLKWDEAMRRLKA
jgi:heme-degrading monooxygenase HmoA